jgi:hypothetical protein
MVGEQHVRRRDAELVGLRDERRDRPAGVHEEALAALRPTRNVFVRKLGSRERSMTMGG